jgi:hypothetical protein
MSNRSLILIANPTPMTILTSYTSATYKAQIRSSVATGFKQLHTGSCTAGERQAAQRIVAKWFGDDAAQTVRRVESSTEGRALVGKFFDDPKRKQVFTVWTFEPKPKKS